MDAQTGREWDERQRFSLPEQLDQLCNLKKHYSVLTKFSSVQTFAVCIRIKSIF